MTEAEQLAEQWAKELAMDSAHIPAIKSVLAQAFKRIDELNVHVAVLRDAVNYLSNAITSEKRVDKVEGSKRYASCTAA